MPLTTYTCHVVGGCDVHQGAANLHLGSTGQGAAPQPVNPPVPLPAAAGGLRIVCGNAAWNVWQEQNRVYWISVAPGAQRVPGPAAGNRCFNIWTAEGVMHFSVT